MKIFIRFTSIHIILKFTIRRFKNEDWTKIVLANEDFAKMRLQFSGSFSVLVNRRAVS